MTSYHVCPVCNEETIETDCYADGDDGGPAHGLIPNRWMTPEVKTQGCACPLSVEQWDAILAAETCEPGDPPDEW